MEPRGRRSARHQLLVQSHKLRAVMELFDSVLFDLCTSAAQQPGGPTKEEAELLARLAIRCLHDLNAVQEGLSPPRSHAEASERRSILAHAATAGQRLEAFVEASFDGRLDADLTLQVLANSSTAGAAVPVALVHPRSEPSIKPQRRRVRRG